MKFSSFDNDFSIFLLNFNYFIILEMISIWNNDFNSTTDRINTKSNNYGVHLLNHWKSFNKDNENHCQASKGKCSAIYVILSGSCTPSSLGVNKKLHIYFDR